MTINYNKCTHGGRLAKEVELKYTQSGKAVASFSLAVQREVKDANGNYQSDFLNFVVWGKAAENMANNLSKGDTILVDSRVQTRTYEKDGKTQYVTEFVVEGFPKFVKVKSWENGSNGTNANANANSNQTTSNNPFDRYATPSDEDLPF